LTANPNARGVLFDLPHVVETAKPVLDAQGLGTRCEAIGGDFFKRIPGGADAHILKQMIHDWDDERAVRP